MLIVASYASYLILFSPVQCFSVTGQTYVVPGRALVGFVRADGLLMERNGAVIGSSHFVFFPTALYPSVKIQ